jgi:uncharacterized NAD-dependent epimerase/dehydratase family protein
MSTPNEGADGNALVYCEGAFGTTNGKTAHGLVRRTRRYRVVGVVDSQHAGQDAGTVLDGRERGIPIVASVEEGIGRCDELGTPASHLVIGLAPDGGALAGPVKEAIIDAIKRGLNVDSGLHTLLSSDQQLAVLALRHKVRLRDVRKPPPPHKLHFFSGKIEEVRSFRVAVLGTDSAVGKRTTAWEIVDGLCRAGTRATLIGTGQTAWMQGACHGVVLDALVNDFVTGEIEHAVHSCYVVDQPQVMIIEGQGSLMNPAYPGGFEILAAARPHLVVLQHAPARRDYDGFPGYPIQPLEQQIQAVELLSGRPVVAITINSEGLSPSEIPGTCRSIESATGRPAFDVLRDGPDGLVKLIVEHATPQTRSDRWDSSRPGRQAAG